MKITQEGNQMVMKDSNFTAFLAGIVFIPLGIAIALFMSKGDVVLMAAGGIFVLVGAVLVLTTKRITISLEKAGECTFSSSSLVGKELTKCNSQQITGIWLDKKLKVSHHNSSKQHSIGIRHGSSTSIRYDYYLNFALDTGKTLDFKFDSLGASTIALNLLSAEQEIVKRAESIAGFIGVPFKLMNQPTPGEMQNTEENPYGRSL